MLAAFAALVICAETTVAPFVVVSAPPDVIVISPLVLVALLATLIAVPGPELMLPPPPTLMLPVLPDVATTPPKPKVEPIPPLTVIDVLPLPPTMFERIPVPTLAVIGPELIVMPPVLLLATMPL